MGLAISGSGLLKNPPPSAGVEILLRKKFGDAKILKKKVWVVAIDFITKSSNSELSSRFFGRLKILQDLEGHHETCEVPIWRSCEFLSVTRRFVSKNYPKHSEIQLSRIPAGGVNRSISIFSSTFWAKPTCTFLLADMMMGWYYELMI